ncbi:hypothetical protein GZ77_06340 [Endozoicomonas montiporae]|uniref:Glycosyl transferase family 1 domain-containing protein n=2 Tax=Endozoicomonas montiporae TaxID=1027273 RepID=A0A081NCA5_9GAMM|nr:glycosyltransferase family 4 protein [Endozoicomonas montiporae]AMO56409.1 group 1 glycosyl transferase [Endozoicomonas montiporae CL-33]KEQ16078.1 hypothetical protein GZ77_06340 [Endozoicomonas montiporae]
MNVLILATKYPMPDESPWLTSELGDELLNLGCTLTVVSVEWGSENSRNYSNCEGSKRINRKKPVCTNGRGLLLLMRWLFSSLKFFSFFFNAIKKREKYDLVISFSPCLAMWFPVFISKYISNYRHVIYWDFFPIHNEQISNKVPKLLSSILKNTERYLLSTFDRVSCMSPANLKFYEKYFGKIPKERDILPIWTSHLESVLNYSDAVDDNDDSVKLVFGGQLVAGRGIDEILNAVKIAIRKNPKIKLLVCGSGELAENVIGFSNQYPDNCRYLGQLDREHYLQVLASSDIGIVATVAHVSCPTFPSKSLDYMASSIPVVASLEASSDFSIILEKNSFGLSSIAGEVNHLADNILTLADNKKLRTQFGINGNNYLKKNHSVSKIALNILERVNVQK